MAADLPRPRAIVVASAHFEVSGGVAVSADPDPETIHDFGGFAPELYAMQYPAPGEPKLARRIADDLQAAGFLARRWTGVALIMASGCRSSWPIPMPIFRWCRSRSIRQGARASLPARPGSGRAWRGGRAGDRVRFLHPQSRRGLQALRAGVREADVPGWVQDFTGWMNERLAKNDVEALIDYRAKPRSP
jgi:4,5-DOPA dioxygenase extradiol